MDREIKIEDNEKFFKSGIGDLDDLKILDNYSREHEEDFQLDLTLAGKTLENNTYYPKLDAGYSVVAEGTRNVERTVTPAAYNFDVVYQPNFKAYYKISSYDPVFDTVIDTLEDKSSIEKDNGNKTVLNIDSTNNLINRKAMTFSHQEKMLTIERSTFFVHRYSDFKNWTKLQNTAIDNEESSRPSLRSVDWDFDRRSGVARAANENYYFSILKAEGSEFEYNDFEVEAEISFRDYKLYGGERDGLAGIAFNVENNNNFYFAGKNNENDKITLFKVENGSKTILKEANDPERDKRSGWFSSSFSTRRKIKVRMLEGKIDVYSNSRHLISYTDSNRLEANGFGLAAYRIKSVSFKDITFDRYVKFETPLQDDFIKYGDNKKYLSTDSFGDIFRTEMDSRLGLSNIESNWKSWWDSNKYKKPMRKYHSFGNLYFSLGLLLGGAISSIWGSNNKYYDTYSHSINTNRSAGQEWVSGWSRDNTKSISLSFTEYGDHWEKDGGLYHSDEDRWRFKVDYSIYYQAEGESSWHYYTRRRSTEDTKNYSSKNRGVTLNFNNLKKYRIKVVYNNFSSNNSSYLKIRSWKEKVDSFYISTPSYIQERLFAYTDVSNSDFVEGNNSKDYRGGDYNSLIPAANMKGFPLLSDYADCRVEIEDVTPVTLMAEYSHYNNPLNFRWSSTGNNNTTAQNDSLILSTDFEIRRNLTGTLEEITRLQVPKIIEDDPDFPGAQIYPNLDSVTIDDDGIASTGEYRLILKLENKMTAPAETEVEFEITRTKSSTYHEINGALRGDNILALPDPNVIETAIFNEPWPQNDEELEEATVKVQAFVNGYFKQSEDGKFDYNATFNQQGTGSQRQINIISNRGQNVSEQILFPKDIDFGTVTFNLSGDYLIYEKTSVVSNIDNIEDTIKIIGETDGGYITKEKIEANIEDLNLIFESSQSETAPISASEVIILSSDILDDGYYLKNWKQSISESGSVSLVEPVWSKLIPEDGASLSSYFLIPENDIGVYSFMAECKNQILSPHTVTLTENEKYKVMVKMTGVMEWTPYIHNGYFYLTDDEDNLMPKEYYLYAINSSEEIPNVSAGDSYYLENFPKQLSPVIIKDSNGKLLKRVSFLDENFNLSLKNKEEAKIKVEETPAKITVLNQEGFEVEVLKKEGNKIYLSELKINPGETVSTEYTYSNSSLKTKDYTVAEDYTITLIEDFISGIFLDYEDIQAESVTIKDKAGNAIAVKDINKNYIELELLENRKEEILDIEYMLNDSFIMDTFKERPELIFSNNYPLGLKINYENSKFTSYFEELEINLNPHINSYNEGFLFISNKKPIMGYMFIDAFPKTIYSDGVQKVYLKVSLIDNYQNPFYNPDFAEGVQLSSNNGSIEFMDYEGNLQSELPEKDMSIPDKFGNVYALYSYLGGDSVEEELIYGQYGDFTASATVNINPRRIKNDLDNSGKTNEGVNKEYHIQITPDKYIIAKGEQIRVTIKTNDKHEAPIEDVPLEIKIRDTFNGSEQQFTVETDKDGTVSFVFYKTTNHTALDTYMIDATAVIDGFSISDTTSVTVMRV